MNQMTKMRLDEIAAAVHGTLNHKQYAAQEVCGVFTDTRTPEAGALFIPLRGENFDGHTYIDAAFDSGAACVLSDVYIETDKPVIRVFSTAQALLDLAGHYRQKFDIPIIALTGSAGKTTTKDLIASVLAERYSVLKTAGNLNNEIGLPMMLFELTDAHKIAVLEMGMSGFGEIRRMSRAAQPDAVVIVNIGTAHIEKLGSRKGILRAKTEALDFLRADGKIFLNGADDMLATLRGTLPNIVFYGTDVYATDITPHGLDGISFTCNGNGQPFRIDVPLPGKHMVSNALAAAAVGQAFGLTNAEIAAGIAKFTPSNMRMDITKRDDGTTIISDVYNANPDAMRAALDVLMEATGRRTAILGDMRELGAHAPALHAEVGTYAASLGLDQLICIGTESRHMAEAAKTAGANVLYYETKEKFMTTLDDVLSKGGAILVKASRGMGFEEITEELRRA